MELVAHIDVKEMKVRFFNTRLEMLIFLSGGEITDFDVFDVSDVFVGESHENIKVLCGM